jgi:hypothetical protein
VSGQQRTACRVIIVGPISVAVAVTMFGHIFMDMLPVRAMLGSVVVVIARLPSILPLRAISSFVHAVS